MHKCLRGRADIVPFILRASNERLRQQLTTDDTLALQGAVYVFTRDHLFASPSMAAVALMGRSANGWTDWKTPQGQTLDEVKRQSVSQIKALHIS